mmetsp:Transcript_27222/g.89218  ORF Transcript_27222/g.89218 Transcript_27222/m.89218 type:complete len:494 (+) Transcript_27222:95-1576(+)
MSSPYGDKSESSGNGGRTHKSPHMRAMKQIGGGHNLLSDLQDYVAGVEALAARRKLDLERAEEEKQVFERKTKALEARMAKQSLAAKEDAMSFDALGDLHPKVRSMLEDSKVLKSRVKAYKEKCSAHERTITAQQQQVLKLTDKVAALEESLARSKRNPKETFDEGKLLEEIKNKDSTISDLEHRLMVISKSKEADLRKYKAALIAQGKEQESLKRDTEELKGAVEEKDKEIRAAALRIRSLQKKLEPVRRPVQKKEPLPPVTASISSDPASSMDSPSGFFLTQAAADTPLMASVNSPLGAGGAVAAAPPVQLVINIVAPELDKPSEAAAAPAEAEEASTAAHPAAYGDEHTAAVVKIQASARGSAARKEVAAKRQEKQETTAATAIQARVKGANARKEVAAIKQAKTEAAEQEKAATTVQAHYKGFQARKDVAALKEAAAPEEEEETTTVTTAKTTPATKAASKPAARTPQPPKGGKPNSGPSKTTSRRNVK